MPILLSSEYYHVEYDAERDLVIIRRTALQMAGPDEAIAGLELLLRAVQKYAGRPALLDLRRVAGNNASRYEAAIRPYLARLRANFSVTARVVQTATGRLQVQRMARERGDDPGCVFLDEEEALNFLMATRGRAGR
ncbi:MAG TPA: hypothetical protein PLW65_18380 [Pseudomonadota bacterium]|nr:hypothetical protein [Pseudomonadota bacterium]